MSRQAFNNIIIEVNSKNRILKDSFPKLINRRN